MLIACADRPDKSLNGIATKSDIMSYLSQFAAGRQLNVFPRGVTQDPTQLSGAFQQTQQLRHLDTQGI